LLFVYALLLPSFHVRVFFKHRIDLQQRNGLMRTILAAFLLLASTQAFGAECAIITLKDVNGLPVKTEGPVVGFMLPGAPAPILDNDNLDPSLTLDIGAKAPCPEGLLNKMKTIFNESCLTTEARASAADLNFRTVEEINLRCQEFYRALGGK